MTPIEILKAIRDDRNVRFLDDTLDKAINEIEELEDTLRILKKVNVKLNIQLNNRELKPISDECMFDNGWMEK